MQLPDLNPAARGAPQHSFTFAAGPDRVNIALLIRLKEARP